MAPGFRTQFLSLHREGLFVRSRRGYRRPRLLCPNRLQGEVGLAPPYGPEARLSISDAVGGAILVSVEIRVQSIGFSKDLSGNGQAF